MGKLEYGILLAGALALAMHGKAEYGILLMCYSEQRISLAKKESSQQYTGANTKSRSVGAEEVGGSVCRVQASSLHAYMHHQYKPA